MSDTHANNHDVPPFIFRKESKWYWVFFVIVAGLSVTGITNYINNENQSQLHSLLQINAQILATILTVTLGITLLGLQFRAQLYTTAGLVKHINDKVVFGFIIIIVSNIMFNLIISTTQTNPPQWIVNFAILGTFFSLLYHIAYIYHIIYKLQPSQFLNDNYEKMKDELKKITNRTYEMNIDDVADDDIEDNKIQTEPFRIWEDVMNKTNNTISMNDLSNGIDMMFNILNDKIKEINKKQKSKIDKRRHSTNIVNTEEKFYNDLQAETKEIIFKSINTTMDFYIKINNVNSINVFIKKLEKEKKYLAESITHYHAPKYDGPYIKGYFESRWGYDLWGNLFKIIDATIINNDEENFIDSIGIIRDIEAEFYNKNNEEHLDCVLETTQASEFITRRIEFCMEHNRYRLMRHSSVMIIHLLESVTNTNLIKTTLNSELVKLNTEYSDKIIKYKKHEIRAKIWRKNFLNLLEMLLYDAAGNDDVETFEYNLIGFKNTLSMILEKHTDELTILKEFLAKSSDKINILYELLDKNSKQETQQLFQNIKKYIFDEDIEKNIVKSLHEFFKENHEKKKIDETTMDILLKLLKNDPGLIISTILGFTELHNNKIEIFDAMRVVSIGLTDTMNFCIKQNRHRVMNRFIAHIRGGDILMKDHDNFKHINTFRKVIFENLEMILLNAIDNDDRQIFDHGMSTMLKISDEILNNKKEKNKNDDFIIDLITNIQINTKRYCNEQKQYRLMEIIKKYSL